MRAALVAELEAYASSPPPPLMVAVASFTVDYDGEVVEIEAGRDRIVADHEIVFENPDAFRPVEPEDGGLTLGQIAASRGTAYAVTVLDRRTRRRSHDGRRRPANRIARPFRRSRQSHRLRAGHRRASSATRTGPSDDPGEPEPARRRRPSRHTSARHSRSRGGEV